MRGFNRSIRTWALSANQSVNLRRHLPFAAFFQLAQRLHAFAGTKSRLRRLPQIQRTTAIESAVMKATELLTAVSLPPLLLGLAMLFAAGCENKETLLDVETPEGQVEVERNLDTGNIDVQATEEEDQLIDSDAAGGADIEVNRDDETGDVDVE
jgi:hypothetical protein